MSSAIALARIAMGLLVMFDLCAAPAADTNTPIVLIGFNRDLVIENTASGPPYTGTALEFNPGEGLVYYQTNLAGKAHGLPTSGSFTSALDASSVFQFQPYTASNALVMSSETGITNGTLFLSTPKIYNSIAVLANSANGGGTPNMTLHFNDGSAFVTNYNAQDWFNNANVALGGVERISITTGATSGAPTNPRFYQTTISLTNQFGPANKPLSSITFNEASGVGATAVYAISGATNPSQGSLIFSLAVITNLSVTSIQTTGAVLVVQVVTTGNDAPLSTIYYGPADGGTNAAAWSNNIAIGWLTGMFTQQLSGLSFSTTYFFTSKAVNAAGTAWAKASKTFATLAPSLAAVTNLAASSILANSASLNGQILSTGGDPPAVTLFYGPANGGTSPAAWSNSVALPGLQGGTFVQGIFGLSANTAYFFAARAVNGAGTAWATPSKSFTTLSVNPVTPPGAVVTQHNDNNRSGENLSETLLNISNVNTNTFGLLYTRAVDDQIYAQPLVMTNVSIPGKGTHNVLYVCTTSNSIYAFDADDSSVVVPYWQTNFNGISGGTNIVPPRNTDMTGACGGNYQDFSGAFGIVGTPVVDPSAKTMWVVVRTKETTATSTNYVQKLHALDITTGAERPNSPVIIAGTFSTGTGTFVAFDPQHNNQRSALTLANGTVFIAWSSHCDWTPYHGWVIAYNATSLAQIATYCDTPNGTQGGVWMSGQGPAADSSGNIYISTGNGTVDTFPSGATNRSMSFLKLSSANLSLMSWFTPYNYSALNGGDYDLGAGGVLLIPGTTLAMGGGKSSSSLPATLYLVNRDNMGGLSSLSAGADTNIVQSIPVTRTGVGFNHIHGSPVWWDGPDGSYAYIWGESDYLHQYKFDRINGVFFLPNYARSATYAPANGMTGGMLAISGNGTNAGTGIVWGSHQYSGDANQAVRPGILHAYNAQNVGTELWNSEQFSARDSVGQYAKFVPPTVANGKVYLATFSGRLNVYGLLPSVRPIIYQQPQPATRYTGLNPVTFTVAAGSTSPMTYKWFKGVSAISGATNSSYTLTNIQTSDAANYSCTVSNAVDGTNTSSAALTVVSAPSITYEQLVSSDGPIAYWRLDESSGTVAYDYLGGHNGQYTNAQLGLAGYNPLDPDTAAGFGTLSANNSYVGNIQGIDFSAAGSNAVFSLEAWVNGGAQINGAGIITEGYGNGGEQFNLDTGNGGKFRFDVRGATAATAFNANGSIAPNNTWQHVVGVCNVPAGTISLYVNGGLNASAILDPAGVYGPPTTLLSIGSRQSGANSTYDFNFNGTIDEVAIYNYALSPAQVQTHYSVGTNGPVTITATPSANKLILTWPLGTLQSATNVTGPYSDAIGVTSPYTNAPSGAQQFYRVRVK